LPDKKRQLQARIATLERQKKELKTKLVDLETAQRTKAAIVTLASKSSSLKVERQAGGLKVRCMPAGAADCWDLAALRTEQMATHDVGQIRREVEA
jgi:hypothetical protein